MALDINSLLNPDAAPMQQDISRQYKLADLLRQQAMEPPQGQMVSGFYVKPNITQNLAKLMQGWVANKTEQKANQETRDLALSQNAALVKALTGNVDPSQAAPMALGLGANQGDVGPTVTNAARMDNMTPASGTSGFGPQGMPAGNRLLAMALDPNAYVSSTLDQYKQTDLQKNMQLAKTDPMMAQWWKKETNIPLVSGRAGAPMYNPDGTIAAMAPKIPDNAIPTIENGQVTGVAPLPGAAQVEGINAAGLQYGKNTQTLLPPDQSPRDPATGQVIPTPISTFTGNPSQSNSPTTTSSASPSWTGGKLSPADMSKMVVAAKNGDPEAKAVLDSYLKAAPTPRVGLPLGAQQTATSNVQANIDLGKKNYDTAIGEATNVPLFKQSLNEMWRLANDPNVKFGPGSEGIARIKALASNIPGVDMAGAQTDQDVMRKLANFMAISQLGGGNATGTNAQLDAILHQLPNGEMTNEAMKKVIPLLVSQMDVKQARANVAQNFHTSNQGDFTNLPDTLSSFNKIADPGTVSLGMKLNGQHITAAMEKQLATQYGNQWPSIKAKLQQLSSMGAFQ